MYLFNYIPKTHKQAAIDLPGIKGLWSLRAATQAPYDKYLVQSFTSETRVLGIEGM
jgi:DNA damage-binding protein 1